MDQNAELNKVFYFTDPEHNALLAESLSTQFFCDKYLDVVFILKESKIIKAHKVVLTAVSQFLTDIVRCSNDVITFISLPDVDYHIMSILIDILYDGATKVNEAELTSLQEVISFLGIELVNFESKIVDPGLDSDIYSDRVNHRRRRPKDLKLKFNTSNVLSLNESTSTSLVPSTSAIKEEVFIKQEVIDDYTGYESYDPFSDCEAGHMEESPAGVGPFDLPLEVLLDTANQESHDDVYTETEPINNGMFPSADETDLKQFTDTSSAYNDPDGNVERLRPRLSNLRNRTSVSREQRHVLIANFKENKFLTPEKKAKLANELDVSEQTISNWFNNRRALEKRSVKKVMPGSSRGKQVFTEKQRQVLEKTFQENKFLDTKDMEKLAKSLGVSLKSVRNWFTHKRFKERTERAPESAPQRGNTTQRGKPVFDKEKRQTLEAMFKECRFPSTETKRKLAKEFGVPEKTINNWFVFRRQKEKDKTDTNSTKWKIKITRNTQDTTDSSVKEETTDDEAYARIKSEDDAEEEDCELEM